MADITKDSFNEANDFTKVVFQRGRDLLDFELNEFQDILRVFSARLGQVGVGLWQAAAATPSYPYSSDNGLQVVPSPTSTPNEVQINAGTFIVDGIVQDYLAPTTLVLPASAATVQYDVVYIAVTEAEVADPNAVPQIGPTTVRRQLSTSVLTYRTASLPIDPSFPANPAAWLWQGQTRYYAVAVVTRPALSTVVTAADILDLRRQTPSRTLDEAARVSDFLLEALITPAVETPVRDVNGIDNLLVVDVNKTNSASLTAINDSVTIRSRQLSGFAQTMATLTRYATTTNGVAGRLALGTNYALYGTSTLRFQDDNIIGTGYPAPVTAKYVQFSSTAGGAAVLRIGEQGAVTQNAIAFGAGTILSANNMLKAVNGRLHVTVGDGTTSFGDFSGVNSIEQALQFFADALTAGSTFTSLEIDVKRGVYTVAAAASISIAASTKVTITGDNPETTVIQVNAAAASGFSVNTGAVFTLRRVRMTGGGAVALLSLGAATAVVVEDCLLEASGFNTVVNNTVNLTCRRTTFRALPGVANTPLVQLRLGATTGGQTYAFEGCVFDTSAQRDIPVVRVQGVGSYVSDSAIENIVFKDCVALLGGAALSGGSTAWNPRCVNTGLIDFAANNANTAGLATMTQVKNLIIEGCKLVVKANAPGTTCLTALRLTMNPTGDFSGRLFTNGFIYLGRLVVNGLDVTLDATGYVASDVSPVIIGLYQCDIDIQNVTIRNVTAPGGVGLHSGKLPYDAYTYMTAEGTVAAAPNSGAAALNAVAGYESSLVFIANRWYPLQFFALVQADLTLGRQPVTRIRGLEIVGIERGSDSIHTCSGELTLVAQDTAVYLSDVEIKNYYDSSANLRIYAPEHRVRLRPISFGSDTPIQPIMELSNVLMSGFAARQGSIVAGTITNAGTGYTDGFYAGVVLTGGAGSSSTANITVSGGSVTSVVIARGGQSYVAGNVLSATLPSGVNFQYTVNAVTAGSSWLSGLAFATYTAAVQAAAGTNTGAYIKLDPVTSPVSANARITLTDVQIRGYEVFVVAQSAAIGCFSDGGLNSLHISNCRVDNTGDGIRVQIPSTSAAYHGKIVIDGCQVYRTNACIVLDGGDLGSEFVNVSGNVIEQSILPVIFATSSSNSRGTYAICHNTIYTQAITSELLFLCDTWPSTHVLPTVTVVGNACNSGNTVGYIKINNPPVSGGGTFPNNGHVWKALHSENAKNVGMETIDTPYNNGNGELYYITDKYMVHNNARFKVGP